MWAKLKNRYAIYGCGTIAIFIRLYGKTFSKLLSVYYNCVANYWVRASLSKLSQQADCQHLRRPVVRLATSGEGFASRRGRCTTLTASFSFILPFLQRAATLSAVLCSGYA